MALESASASGTRASSGVLQARSPHPEFLRPLGRSSKLSDCPSTGQIAELGAPPGRERNGRRGSGEGVLQRQRTEARPRRQPGPTPESAAALAGTHAFHPGRPHPSRGGDAVALHPAGARPPGLQEGGAQLRARCSWVLPPPRRAFHGCPTAGRRLLSPAFQSQRGLGWPVGRAAGEETQGRGWPRRLKGGRDPERDRGSEEGGATSALGGKDAAISASPARSRSGGPSELRLWPCGGWGLLGSPALRGWEALPGLENAGLLI